MDIRPYRILIAWMFIAVAGVAMITTLRGNHTVGPIIPALVPVFGRLFAIVFIVLQVGFCLGLRSPIGLIWMVGAILTGFLGGMLGQATFGDPDYDWMRHRIVAGACVSAIVLGVLVVRDKLPMRA